MDIRQIMDAVPEWETFHTVAELNALARERAKTFGFEIKQFGKTSVTHEPLYYVKAGNGKKTALVWAFPHPNEPIGTLLIDFLVEYFGKHPSILEETEYTWYFVYNADPEGARLNEGWFKKPFSLMNYFTDFYRPPAHRMIDWTFPINYKDSSWDKPMEETRALMHLIDTINPDVMYPLHNAGFEAAWFTSTKRLSHEYYTRIRKVYGTLGIPLHIGEPEEPFMKEIEKSFFHDISFAGYYEHTKKIGEDTKKLIHGDNSTGYLLRKNQNALVIKAELPYFITPALQNTALSHETRRDIWLRYLDAVDRNRAIISPYVQKAAHILKEPDPYFYLARDYLRKAAASNDSFRNHIRTSEEYDRKATHAEVATEVIGSYFYGGGLRFAQTRRAAIAAHLDSKDIALLEEKMHECARKLDAGLTYTSLPLRTLVQAQLVYLLETLYELHNNP